MRVSGMRFLICLQHSMRSVYLQARPLTKSGYLLSALLLIGCQPNSPTEAVTNKDNDAVEIPLISADSVTITRDHILSIKPTRYQPSLGLQGRIEPIKHINLVAVQPIKVEQVLVSENQWVKEGTPLLTVQTQTPSSKTMDSDKLNSLNNIDSSNSSATETNTINNLITLRASFSGRVENLSVQAGQEVTAQTPLLKLSDETQLHFVSTLPIEAESQISVGQTVNFTAEDRVDIFTGQVSKVQAIKQPIQLLVYVNVVNNEVSRNQIVPGIQVTGRVDYGQIEVGTIVPKEALNNVDLTQLQVPPYKPLRSLSANIWIIGQDQRLIRQPIEVIEYDPLTKQYLITGITNDSLICVANLPIESKGKKVVVS